MKQAEKKKLIGTVSPLPEGCCFSIPVLSDSSGIYIQVIRTDNTIADFDEIAHPGDQLLPTELHVERKIDDDALFAFDFGNKDTLIGSHSVIAEKFRLKHDEYTDRPFLLLDLGLFLQDLSIIHKSLKLSFNKIDEENSDTAKKWLLSLLWNKFSTMMTTHNALLEQKQEEIHILEAKVARLERKLWTVSQELEDRKNEAQELTEKLQNAQKMEVIGVSAGSIAHDFNNLLMGIGSYASLMLHSVDPSHRFYDHLRKIEDWVENASNLSRQLSGFVRRGKYAPKLTNLNDLLKMTFMPFIRTKKPIAVFTKAQEDIWLVDVDRVQMEQVLEDLYVNARQTMTEGGHLYLETENVILDENYVKPFSVNPGRYVKISVTYPRDMVFKRMQGGVFKPFFGTKETGRGAGLGLASAYKIIKNHGGAIDVYSEKGEGASFNIYIPASDKEVVEGEKMPQDVLRGNETILLVDDEEIILDVGKEILEELGYRVFEARSGKEAIDLYRKESDEIDLVILDMVMPDMDGREIFDRLKEFDKGIKVLLASGHTVDEKGQDIFHQGFKGSLKKPFETMALQQKIRELLEKE